MRLSVIKIIVLIVSILGLFGVIFYFSGLSGSRLGSAGAGFAGGLGYVFLLESAFRVRVRLKTGKPYQLIPKIPFEEMYIEPHPYISYVYKKNVKTQREVTANYEFMGKREYRFGCFRTNNFRHINGPDGGRDIIVPKPEGLYRIHCLGASTTANYLIYKEEAYSYPLQLEKVLKSRFPDRNIEVNNCGVGGYTTAEILVKFLLDLIDTKPDLVVFYHGYNDLPASLTTGFQSDYSHARRNLGETYHQYRTASRFPYIPLAVYNFFVNVFFPQNLRYTLLASVARGMIDIQNEFKGLETYKRNIEHLIHICNGNGIQIVLSTFCHYLHSRKKMNPLHLKYGEGVVLENEIIKELAQKHSLPLVDNDALIPRQDDYFVDSIHFSHQGI